MKTLLPIIALCLISSVPPRDEYTLYQALSSSLVSAEIEVNDKSSHYHKPFVLNLRNISDRQLNIIIENGTKLVPEDEQYQNFTTVRQIVVRIPAKRSLEVPLNAMCMEAHDRAPSQNSAYRFSGKVNDKMIGLTKLIEANELYSYMGQDAVWAVAEGRSARSICGYNYEDGLPLISYVAKLNGEEIPKPPSEDDYERNFRTTSRVVKSVVRGEFNFNSGWVANIQIGLFNEQNTVVRELFNNPETPIGPQKVKYEFDHSVYTDDFYTVRMMVDGELFLESKFSFDPEEWPADRG